PAPANACATGSMPQPYPSALMTAAHSDGVARRPRSCQLATIAARLTVKMPPVCSDSMRRPAGMASAGKSDCRAVSALDMMLGLAARSPPVHAGSYLTFRQTACTGQRGEPGYCGIELQFDGSGGSMALLANNDFSLAMHFVCFCQPLRELFAIGF